MKYQYSTIPVQSSCPGDDALRIAQAKKEREREHLQNNNKVKHEH
jgi:hypothetical protein